MNSNATRSATPRPAATVLVLRDSTPGIEVLMVRRSPTASFMPNAYVFPGGAVDIADSSLPSDESDDEIETRLGRAFAFNGAARSFAVAACRETFEESGLWLGLDDPAIDLAKPRHELSTGTSIGEIAHRHRLPVSTSMLQPWSRWVTPFGLPKRFDTVFFVCQAPRGQVPAVDAAETTALHWIDPAYAMAECEQGRFQMEFATRAIIRSLLPLAGGTVDRYLAHARGLRNLAAVHPRVHVDSSGKRRALMPGEAGYDELPGDPSPIR
ncbi:MAG: NUDIX hydrolase [Burkholderiaceae bacterium]|nr:NUDIX hydrolase [Burkholderiaceae bacterium]MEB2318142.1 NUDIX hydrolase [Pseudomonadota bacterium]